MVEAKADAKLSEDEKKKDEEIKAIKIVPIQLNRSTSSVDDKKKKKNKKELARSQTSPDSDDGGKKKGCVIS